MKNCWKTRSKAWILRQGLPEWAFSNESLINLQGAVASLYVSCHMLQRLTRCSCGQSSKMCYSS